MHRQMGPGAAALACTLAFFAAGCGADTGASEEKVTAFETRSLTFDHCKTTIDDFDPSSGAQYAGNDRGGIALTRKGIVYNGDSAAVAYDKVSLKEPPAVLPMRDGLVEDLQTRDIYSLGTQSGTLLDSNVNWQGPWDSLFLLNPNTLLPGRRIALSQPITFTSYGDNGVFAGYGHVYFYDGNAATFFKVELEDGTVTPVPDPIPFYFNALRVSCENWAIWGWTETFGGNDYVVYSANVFGTPAIIITGVTTPYGDYERLMPSSDMCSIVPDPENGRWYFHYQVGAAGLPGYPNSGEIVGYCDATFSYGKSL